jgi:hypothetical protein
LVKEKSLPAFGVLLDLASTADENEQVVAMSGEPFCFLDVVAFYAAKERNTPVTLHTSNIIPTIEVSRAQHPGCACACMAVHASEPTLVAGFRFHEDECQVLGEVQLNLS